MSAHLSAEEQSKEYIKVFKWLIALTIIEVAAVFLEKLHVPKLVVTLIVVIFSCAKAVLVGYYYMHLKYEARWLQIVAILPIIAFAYALVLGADYKIYLADHAPSKYIPEPPRVFPESEKEEIEEPIVLIENEDSSPVKEAAPQTTEAPKPEAGSAPAAGGGGDWN